jgi:pentatricopeptide repeat protein
VSIDPEEHARHLVAAADGPDSGVAAEVERGAERARVRGAPGVAASLADSAVALTPEHLVADRIRRHLAAGYHWVIAGQCPAGRTHVAAARALTGGGPAHTELSWRLGMLCHLDGDTPEGIRLLEGALAVTDNDPAMRATIQRKLASLYSWMGRTRESRTHAADAVRHARTAGDPRLLCEALITRSVAALYAGEPIPAEVRARIAALAEQTGPYPPHEDPEGFLGYLAFLEGDLADASARTTRLLRRSEEHGDEFGIVGALSYLSGVELAAGRWAGSRGFADDALDRLTGTNLPLTDAAVRYAAAVVYAHLGDVDTALGHARRLAEAGQRTGMLIVEAWGRWVLGFLALSQADAVGAHTELGPLRRQLDEAGVRDPSMLYVVWLDIDALVALGRFDEAEAVAEEMHARGEALDRPFVVARAARARGLVLAGRHRHAAAIEELTRAAAWCEEAGAAFDHGLALLGLGTVLLRDRSKRAGREHLERARTIFDDVGATLWRAWTDTELARVGGRRPSGRRLTPAEARVARLVTDGMSNRAAAARLFLSERTVADHLTNVFAKLHVRSRAELVRYLRDHPLPPD